ncbi:MAG: helix-turn-helix transcriptional regulator [Aquificaceae bacterium]
MELKLSDFLRKLVMEKLEEKGISVLKFSETLDFDKKTVYGFVNGSADVRLSTVEKIFSALGITYADLQEKLQEGGAVDYAKLDVYGSVSAGNGIELIDKAGDLIVPPEFKRENYIAILVRGDSMEPSIVDGSIVIIDKTKKLLEHGKIFVFYIPYKGAVIKRVFFLSQEKVLLKSDNEAYGEFCFTKQEMSAYNIQVVGKVVASWQLYR